MPATGPRAKNWCFTLNNYEYLLDLTEIGDLTYCIYQEEVGASGTPHLQGYMQFSVRKRLVQLKELPGLEGAHWEAARGSLADNVAYCTKDEGRVGGPYEYGARDSTSSQGDRNDVLALKRSIEEGVDKAELWERHPDLVLRHYKAIKIVKGYSVTPRNHMMTVLLFIGPPGTGKTRTATTLASYLGQNGKFYMVPPTKGSGLYWDNYDYEDTVIIDEMDGNRMSPTFFNQLCDRYPLEVPVHGSGGVQFTSKHIIICTNYHPAYWWKKSAFKLQAVMRRITCVVKMIHCAAGEPKASRAPTFSYNSTREPLIPFFAEHL